MTLTPLNLSSLLAKYHITPKRSLGQNFLWDPNILERIVAAADIQSGDHVLEIGSGLGTLTRHLAQSARHVIAVEIDVRMKPALEEVLADYPNVEIVIGDMLEIAPAALFSEPGYLVIANIPYYITSNLIRHLLESELKPNRLVLTLQREVASRICTEPGDLSLLALSVQLYGYPQILSKIPAGAFFPVPKVDSAVLRIDLYPQPVIPAERIDLFFRLAKAGFKQKRKKMRNALADGLNIKAEKVDDLLVQAGIDPASRAQMLDLNDWSHLVGVWIRTNQG